MMLLLPSRQPLLAPCLRPPQMTAPLLTTKLNTPPRRPNLVPRPQLLARLQEGLLLNHSLTLVSARAGSGKTTLVSEWLSQQERLTTWLSLDANDDEPRRFFSYLLAALQPVSTGIGQALMNQMDGPQLPRAETVVVGLINELASAPTPFMLVLDDYHLIEHEWIHQAVAFLAERQPQQMHLVLVTRIDPPLPLTRLRGRGQLTEIRDRDLRFSVDEAADFLNEVMELDLPAAAVSTMEARTEGWIVGLQMAAISMRGLEQDGGRAAFVEAFRGTHRYILDYLAEEVLGQQPPSIQRFLIETSVLERLCAELCDALRFPQCAAPEAADERSSQAILLQLERVNLFLIPLDEQRRWYRYHHLFADLLNSLLRERSSASAIRALHQRASRWHRQQGSLEEAMIHALAAEDYEAAAAMIDENIVRMLSRSEGPVLLGWIEKLPDEIALGRPWIDVYRAYTLALSGRPDEADPLLEDAERQIQPDTPRVSELRGHIAAIRSYTANLWGDAERVFEMAALAERYLAEEHLISRAMAAYALTVTHFATDDIERSTAAAREMLQIGRQLDRLLLIITPLCDLAAASMVQGKLHLAKDYYDQAHSWLVAHNGLDSRVRCPLEAGRADLLLQWNQLDAAYEHAITAIAYSRRFHVPSEQVTAHLTLMRIFQLRGDMAKAEEALRDAEQLMENNYLRLSARIEVRTARVQHWLAAGDLDTAIRWAGQCHGGSEREQLAVAHLHLAQGHLSQAQQLLGQQRATAEAGGRRGRLIEIMALQAVVLEALGERTEADATLSQALSLARPEGYLYPFLKHGAPLHVLLVRLVAEGAGRESQDALAAIYLQELLAAFEEQKKLQKSNVAAFAPLSPALAAASFEPLTERELDVLRLLPEGLTNKEMAERLVVAPSTVKQHLKHIYGKLDVHSRTHAVTRARELGLLW